MAKKTRLGNKPLQKQDFSDDNALSWISEAKENFVPEGIRLSEIQYVEPRKLRTNDLNNHFKNESSEYFDKLIEDIRERGIIVPLIAKPDGTLLAGHNRLIAAMDIPLERVPVQYTIDDLSESKEKEFIFKDNILRRQFSAQDKKEIIKSLYPKEISQDKRGGDRRSKEAIKSSSELSIPLPEKIEQETGIKAGTAKRLLASIRKELRGEKKERKTEEIHPVQKHLNAIGKILSSQTVQAKAKSINMIKEFFDEIIY